MTNALVAEAAIRDLYARYTDAIFRKDADAFGDLFIEDAEWRISGLLMRGRAEIVERIKAVFPNYRRILMHFHYPMIELSGGTANVRIYVRELSAFQDGRPFGPIGTYFDRCVEEGGRWRFAWRLFQTQYAGPPDMTGQFFDNPDFGPPPAMPPLDTMAIDHTGVLKRQQEGKA
jgi:ketosteroid isomerase-like protein